MVLSMERSERYELLVPEWVDERLWVVDESGNRGYLAENPHTFVGRFTVFWPHLGGAYSASVQELSACSNLADVWLRGYLAGSEPGPPSGPVCQGELRHL
jgi:hypothetical protein